VKAKIYKNLILFLKTLAFLHRTPTNAAAPFTKKKGKTSGSSHTIDKDGQRIKLQGLQQRVSIAETSQAVLVAIVYRAATR